jgi:hypothetical protein
VVIQVSFILTNYSSNGVNVPTHRDRLTHKQRKAKKKRKEKKMPKAQMSTLTANPVEPNEHVTPAAMVELAGRPAPVGLMK